MITALANILRHFPGPTNRVHCMAHIVNLVVKIILQQFDIPSKKNRESDDDPAADDSDLADLAQDLEKEETEMDNGDNAEDMEDIANDVIDIEESLREDIANAAKHVKPVRCVLLKVLSHLIHTRPYLTPILRFSSTSPPLNTSLWRPTPITCLALSSSCESSHTPSRIHRRSSSPGGRRSLKICQHTAHHARSYPCV